MESLCEPLSALIRKFGEIRMNIERWTFKFCLKE